MLYFNYQKVIIKSNFMGSNNLNYYFFEVKIINHKFILNQMDSQRNYLMINQMDYYL